MDNSIATASRNVFRIKRRKYTHYGFRALQKVVGEAADDAANALFLYPRFESAAELGDVLNRLAWYLPEPTRRPDLVVRVPADPDVLAGAHDRTPDAQAAYDTERLPLERVAAGDEAAAARRADKVLAWDASGVVGSTGIRNLGKVEIVDPAYWSTYPVDTWERLSGALRVPDEDPSAERFAELARSAADYDEAFVFATGPSLSEATDYEFPDDSLKIICNSIVRDDELLAHLEPDVLTFADPVFHFGPNRYADTFRGDALDVLRTYDCVGVVPPEYRTLLAGHYGSDLPLVGVDRVRDWSPNFPSAEDLRVWATGNIMTLYMLPIASALVDDVYVVGADGREEDESYFWEHDDDAQYDDELMRTVADTHPSFFRDRIYEDYYQRHVEILTEMIEYGERRGVDYHSLTHSYVPCLRERRVEGLPGTASS